MTPNSQTRNPLDDSAAASQRSRQNLIRIRQRREWVLDREQQLALTKATKGLKSAKTKLDQLRTKGALVVGTKTLEPGESFAQVEKAIRLSHQEIKRLGFVGQKEKELLAKVKAAAAEYENLVRLRVALMPPRKPVSTPTGPRIFPESKPTQVGPLNQDYYSNPVYDK